MEVSIVIVNFNHKYFIKLAVEALEKSVFNGKFEIIVVDNGSNDEVSLSFKEKAQKDGRIKLIRGKNIGFGAGNNLGAKEARGKYILFHNPDVTVSPDSIQKLYDFAEKNVDAGLIAPKLVYANGKIQESCRRNMSFFDLVIKRTPLKRIPRFKKRLNSYLMGDYNHDETQDVELATGAAMFVKNDFFKSIGGFDERYFLFMEDFDLCKKVWAEKKRVVYFTETEFMHYHKRLSHEGFIGSTFKKVFWLHVSSAIKYFWKWR